MVGCDGLFWHQCIVGYCLHADKELVEKISQDAKERMKATQIQDPATGKFAPGTAPGREPVKTGEVTEVLAEIAGTGATIIKEVLRVKRDGVPELEDINTYKVHR